MTAYNLGTNYASATYNFVPNGAKVTQVHDIIETASCNACHDQLSAHGGSRRGLNMCVLCHQPQNMDPNTGVHLGCEGFLSQDSHGREPSQRGARGRPHILIPLLYQPSTRTGRLITRAVVFPATSCHDPRDCEVCHSQTTGAAQKTAFLTNPTRVACGSCHDNVNFATGANHPGGPQYDDNQCATCHIPQGTDFDASILGAHVVPTSSSLLSGLIVNITNSAERHGWNRAHGYFTVRTTNKNAGCRFRS